MAWAPFPKTTGHYLTSAGAACLPEHCSPRATCHVPERQAGPQPLAVPGLALAGLSASPCPLCVSRQPTHRPPAPPAPGIRGTGRVSGRLGAEDAYVSGGRAWDPVCLSLDVPFTVLMSLHRPRGRPDPWLCPSPNLYQSEDWMAPASGLQPPAPSTCGLWEDRVGAACVLGVAMGCWLERPGDPAPWALGHRQAGPAFLRWGFQPLLSLTSCEVRGSPWGCGEAGALVCHMPAGCCCPVSSPGCSSSPPALWHDPLCSAVTLRWPHCSQVRAPSWHLGCQREQAGPAIQGVKFF